MKTVARLLLGLTFFLFFSAAAEKKKAASGGSSAPHKLVALKVTGITSYSDKEILAASGLQIGQTAADGDFKEAVQSLGDSGMFSAASYSYSTSVSGVRLEIQLSDVDRSKLVPAQFENFVWFSDEELRAGLLGRVSLFKGLLPLGGNLPDHVTEALQAMLTEKRLPGRVTFLRKADRQTGTVTSINYRVEEASIRIRGVEFPAASPEQTVLLTEASRVLIGAEYSRSAIAAVAKLDLLPVYFQRGYLKADFGSSSARVVKQSSAEANAQSAEIEVDAILPVTPGRVYSTSGVDWRGNSALSATELAALVHLPVGEPADTVRLRRDLDNLGKLYRSRGYMMAQIKPDSQLNDDNGTVHYELNIVEGDLFRMGELDLNGLNTGTIARLRAAWTLHEGQPYNANYPAKFVEDTREMLPRGVQWKVSVHETPDARDKTVDVDIRFTQQ
jgi:outer membrane protein assembly factor BamA